MEKPRRKDYSSDPAYYPIALKELTYHIGDPGIAVKAFVKQLEAWHPNNDYNIQNFVSFASSLKRLVEAFDHLGFKVDSQSPTFMKKATENKR